MRRLLFVLTIAAIYVGGIACDGRSSDSSGGDSSKSSSTTSSGMLSFLRSKPDPAESFKTFAIAYQSAARQQLTNQARPGRLAGSPMQMKLLIFDKYSVDVRKTDSLISPYMGIVQFGAQQTNADQKTITGFQREFPLVLTFALQDDKWILKSAEVTDQGFDADGDGYWKGDLLTSDYPVTVRSIQKGLRLAAVQAGGG